MYCQNCGAKIPNPKAKFCPSCGSPVIHKKKTSPIIDAIILGVIIVLFIFAVIKISELITDYKMGKIYGKNANMRTNIEKFQSPELPPEVRAPNPGGESSAKTLNTPKNKLESEIKQILKGISGEILVFYNKNLGGYEVDVTVYHNNSLTTRNYLDYFGKILSLCYGNPKSNVKFVVCKVKEKDRIKLSIALGAAAASKIPPYSWEIFGNNTTALIRWIKKHETETTVAKLTMCRFYNNL